MENVALHFFARRCPTIFFSYLSWWTWLLAQIFWKFWNILHDRVVKLCYLSKADFFLLVFTLLLLSLCNFHFYFRLLMILLRVFTLDGELTKVVIICIQFVFCCLFWVIFFSYIESTFRRRWAVLQSAIFVFDIDWDCMVSC